MADQNQSVPASDNISNQQAPTTDGNVPSGTPPPPPWVSQPSPQEAQQTDAQPTTKVAPETQEEASPPSETSSPSSVPPPPPGAAAPVEPTSLEAGTLPETPAGDSDDIKVQEKIHEQEAPKEEGPPVPPWVSSGAGATETQDTPAPLAEQPGVSVDQGAAPPPAPPAPAFSTTSVASSGGGAGQPQASIFKKLIPILGALAFIGLLFFVITKFVLPNFLGESGEGASKKKTSGKQITLTYWGLWEPESVMNQVIADYQQETPNISINYIKQSHKDYRERLQSSLTSGEGPDIFRMHNTWTQMFKDEISPAPKETIDINLFFPAAKDNLVFSEEIYGVPLEFDGLALFYNPKIFNQAGKSVPTSWEELRKIATELTVKDSSGKIQTAGVALGTTNNVDHFSDILGLMLLQNGADPANAESQLTQDAIQFYTIFTTTDKVWDETLPSSTYAFATEKVAMFFAPSWRVFEIKEINPSLEFKTAPVPQLPGTQIAWASYWAESVSKKSKNTKEAWDFLKYLSSEEVVTKLYTAESNLRLFGEPYALKSLVSTLESDPYVGAFVKQGPYAKSWYLCSRTFDNGINDGVIKYYEDAINSIVSGKELQSTIKTLSSGVSQVLSRYGLGKAPTQQISEPKENPSTSSGTRSLPEAI